MSEAIFAKIVPITTKFPAQPWAKYAGTVNEWLERVEKLYKIPKENMYAHLLAGNTVKIGNVVYKLGETNQKRCNHVY